MACGAAALAQDAPERPSGTDGSGSADRGAPATGAGIASPILTLDQDAMFAGSAFGQRIIAELEADRNALAAENRRIEQELGAEERALTEQRATLPPEDFTALAEAFDAKVQRIRSTQDQKARTLQARLDAERQRFGAEAGPVLAAIARERGAMAVLDDTVVLMSFDRIDITAEAIARLDAAIGDGNAALGNPTLEAPRMPDPTLRPTPRVLPGPGDAAGDAGTGTADDPAE